LQRDRHAGTPFKPSDNKYDWLGQGIYFWEANPLRGLEFATEAAKREPSRIKEAFVIGAIINWGSASTSPQNSD
jgi:hypothetical protein